MRRTQLRFLGENSVWRPCGALKVCAPLPRGPAVRPRFFLLIIHNFEEAYLFVWFRISSQIDVLLQSYELFYSKLSVLSLNGAGEEEEEEEERRRRKKKEEERRKKKTKMTKKRKKKKDENNK